MARSAFVKTQFNAGELSPKLVGRSDVEQYANGCSVMQNFLPLVQGGAHRRSGTRFVAEAKFANRTTILIPFQFSVAQAYVLEFGHEYVRFYRDRDQLMDDGKLKRAVGASTTPYEIVSPYESDDLAELKWTQSADVLFLTHPDYQPRELRRSGDISWAFVLFDFKDGPWLEIGQKVPTDPVGDVVTTTMTPSAVTGSGITITASAPTFDANDVGRLIRIRAGDKPITRFGTFAGGSKTLVTSVKHGINSGDKITVVGTADYNGDYTATKNNVNRFVIEKTFTFDNAVSANEVVSIRVQATSGTFTLTHEGNTTAALAYDIAAATLETTLEALASINSVTVTGGPGDASGSSPYIVTFNGADANTDMGDITGDGSSLGGAGILTITETTKGNDGSEAAWLFTEGTNADDTWGNAKITAFTSSTIVTADVKQDFNSTQDSITWRLGAWSTRPALGWPHAAAFHDERLWFGATDGQPQTVWGSKVADFDNFQPSNPDNDVVSDDDSPVFTISDSQVNAIRWLQSMSNGLVALTAGGPYLIFTRSTTDPLSPTNIEVRKQTNDGVSKSARPIFLGDALLYVQRAGERIRQMAFDLNVDQFSTSDVSVLAEHMLESPVLAADFQQEPMPVAWFVTERGLLIGMTYDRQQRVIAFHHHPLGGRR
jgi:hypothetical protein